MRIISLGTGEGKSRLAQRWLSKDYDNRVLLEAIPINYPDVRQRNSTYSFKNINNLKKLLKENPNLKLGIDDVEYFLSYILDIDVERIELVTATCPDSLLVRY